MCGAIRWLLDEEMEGRNWHEIEGWALGDPKDTAEQILLT